MDIDGLLEALNLGHSAGGSNYAVISGNQSTISMFGIGLLAATEHLSYDTFIAVKHAGSGVCAVARTGQRVRDLFRSRNARTRFCIWSPGQESADLCGPGAVCDPATTPYFQDEAALRKVLNLVEGRHGVAILMLAPKHEVEVVRDHRSGRERDIVFPDQVTGKRESVGDIVATYLRADMEMFPVRETPR